jgi:hypothetical protein
MAVGSLRATVADRPGSAQRGAPGRALLQRRASASCTSDVRRWTSQRYRAHTAARRLGEMPPSRRSEGSSGPFLRRAPPFYRQAPHNGVNAEQQQRTPTRGPPRGVQHTGLAASAAGTCRLGRYRGAARRGAAKSVHRVQRRASRAAQHKTINAHAACEPLCLHRPDTHAAVPAGTRWFRVSIVISRRVSAWRTDADATRHARSE